MEKEIETLLNLKENHYRGYLTNDEYIEKVNEVLNNYVNDYNNAKPSEALEELNVIEENLTCELRKLSKIGDKELAIEIAVGLADKFEKAIKPIKQALIEGQKDKQELAKYKALKITNLLIKGK